VKDSAGAGVTNRCRFHRAVALSDLKSAPILSFHRAMITCFAAGMKSPYQGLANLTAKDTQTCKELTFDKVPQ
jgi:hypothetical protein